MSEIKPTSFAILIGIDKYSNIRPLKNAVSDATAIAEVLKKTYKYKVLSLIDGEATRDNLNNLLKNLDNQTIPFPDKRIQVEKRDRLLFYFAGHGFAEPAQDSEDGKPIGYLMPQDAEPNNNKTWLSMQKLYKAFTALDCHHLLMILDCCFAGSIRWAGLTRNSGGFGRKMYRQSYDRFIKFPAHQVLTSAAYDEEAQDSSRFGQRRGEKNKHSPFAHLLLKVLNINPENVKDDISLKAILQNRVITAQELFTYLQNQLGEEAERQTPGIFRLKKRDKGEYIFPLYGFERKKLEELKLDKSTNPYKGLASFETKDSQLFFGRKRLIEGSKDPQAPKYLKEGLLLQVSKHPLTVVLGPSGSGKSSLVKAGLIPALKQAGASGEKWQLLHPMRPGAIPLTALARTILPIKNVDLVNQLNQLKFLDNILNSKTRQEQESGLNDEEKLNNLVKAWEGAIPASKLLLVFNYFEQLEKLCSDSEKQRLSDLKKEIESSLNPLIKELQKDSQDSPQYLTKIFKEWSQNNQSIKLLLMIDQCEELITLCQNDRERERFLQLLSETLASQELSKNFHIVLTLRSGFEPQLRDAIKSNHWQEGRFFVTPMDREELQQVIEEPAAQRALFFESPKLVNQLIDEVIQMPGALPLLSFTLSELYLSYLKAEENKERHDRTITETDYQKIGGVTCSLVQTADRVYDELVEKNSSYEKTIYEKMIRNVMLRMVAISGGKLARRRVPKSELEYPEKNNKQAQKVINRFVEARLLTRGMDDKGHEYVEPVHDALVKGWGKIQGWLDNKLRSNKELSSNDVAKVQGAGSRWNPIKKLLNRSFGKVPLPLASKKEDSSKRKSDLEESHKAEQPLMVDLPLQRELTTAAFTWHDKEKEARFLWNASPYLDVLKQVLQSEQNNWFNKVEKEFVKCSVGKKRQNTCILLVSFVVGILIISWAAIFSFIQWKNAQKQLVSTISVLANNSQELFDSNKEFDALLASLNAGKKFQQLPLGENPDLQMRIKDALQNAVIWVKEQNRLKSPNGSVKSVGFSPNCRLMAFNSADGIIKLWDVTTGKIIHTPNNNNLKINSFSFIKDGLLAFNSADGTIKLWNVTTDNIVKTLDKKKLGINSVSFSPNGWIASHSENDTLKIWDLTTGKVINTLDRNSDSSTSDRVYFSRDGQRLVSQNEKDKTFTIWDVTTGKAINTFKREGSGFIDSVSFSPNGKLLVYAGEDKIIHLWDIPTGKEIKTLQRHTDRIRSISFSPNGQILASAGWDASIKLWNVATGEEIKTLMGHKVGIESITFGSNKLLASASSDGIIKLWDISPHKEVISLNGHLVGGGISFSPDGKLLASTVDAAYTNQSNTIKLWDVATHQEIATLIGHEHWIKSVSFSPDGQWLASVAWDSKIQLWDVRTCIKAATCEASEILQFKDDQVFFSSVSFSPDGKLLATAGNVKWNVPNNIQLWDIANYRINPKPIKILPGHKAFVNSVSFSPDGKLLASASDDQTIKIWDVAKGKEIETLEEHSDEVKGVSFSLDGKQLTSASTDQTIKLWDVATGEKIKTLRGHTGQVVRVIFSPDGKWLISGSNDKTIKIWDVAKGKVINTLKGHRYAVGNFSLSHDGKLLASASDPIRQEGKQELILWNLKILSNLTIEELMVQGCNWVDSYLKNNPKVLLESDPRLCNGIVGSEYNSDLAPRKVDRRMNR